MEKDCLSKNQKYTTLTQLVSCRNQELKDKDNELKLLNIQQENWVNEKADMIEKEKKLVQKCNESFKKMEDWHSDKEKLEQTINDLKSELNKLNKKLKHSELVLMLVVLLPARMSTVHLRLSLILFLMLLLPIAIQKIVTLLLLILM